MADNLADVYVRFDGLKGECTDAQHSGDDGWVEIKGFSFSFGLKSSGAGKPALPATKDLKTPEQMKAAMQKMQEHLAAQQQKKPAHDAKDDGPFDRSEVTLNKTLDLASPKLWKEKCHTGTLIPKIEVVACRYGGTEGLGKIPFLTLVFENAQVKSISMGISADERPSESLRFSYDTVKLKYIWTANDCGDRVKGAASPRAGWDFEANRAPEWGPNE